MALPAEAPARDRDEVLEHGLYARHGGDTIQLAPPFITEKPELDRRFSILANALVAARSPQGCSAAAARGGTGEAGNDLNNCRPLYPNTNQ
jgi:hypothetical protein